MYSRMTSAAFLAGQCSRLMAVRLQEALKPFGLAPAQFMVLVDLAGGQKRTQRELAARLDVEQPTMANTLARMERDGLLTRTANPHDKRVAFLSATPRAEAVYAQAAKAAISVNERAVRGLTTEERLRFLGTLARVIDNLKDEPPQ
jgi:DNA-binding MarR family transcriptional regulator